MKIITGIIQYDPKVNKLSLKQFEKYISFQMEQLKKDMVVQFIRNTKK